MRYNNSETYRVYNPATRRIMESKNVILIETQSRLLPPPSEETSPQISYSSNGMDDYNIINRDFLRDLRDYTFVLEPLSRASANHIALGGLSDNPPVAELLARISEITFGTRWTEELQDHRKKGRCPGESLRTEIRWRAFSHRRRRRCHPRERPWKHHWLDHSRFNRGDIRAWKRLLRLRVPAPQHNCL